MGVVRAKRSAGAKWRVGREVGGIGMARGCQKDGGREVDGEVDGERGRVVRD